MSYSLVGIATPCSKNFLLDRRQDDRPDARELLVVSRVPGSYDLVMPREVRKGVEGSTDPFLFATTHWSVVLSAQGESPAAEAALERLCRTYWWPLYGFVRREGYPPDEAQDLTQGFFALLLQRKDLEAVRREKGRLRSYLLAGLKNFLRKAHRHATAGKRGGGRPLVALEDLLARERSESEPADRLSPDRIYERRWALTLLEQVLGRLREEYATAGRADLFAEFKEGLVGEPVSSQAEIGRKLKMNENAVKQAFFRLRERYRQLLREEIAHTVATPGEIADELRHLIAVLQD